MREFRVFRMRKRGNPITLLLDTLAAFLYCNPTCLGCSLFGRRFDLHIRRRLARRRGTSEGSITVLHLLGFSIHNS